MWAKFCDYISLDENKIKTLEELGFQEVANTNPSFGPQMAIYQNDTSLQNHITIYMFSDGTVSFSMGAYVPKNVLRAIDLLMTKKGW